MTLDLNWHSANLWEPPPPLPETETKPIESVASRTPGNTGYLGIVLAWKYWLFVHYPRLGMLVIWVLFWSGNTCYLGIVLAWEYLLFGYCSGLGILVIWVLFWPGNTCYLGIVLVWEYLLFGYCSGLRIVVIWALFWPENSPYQFCFALTIIVIEFFLHYRQDRCYLSIAHGLEIWEQLF